MAKFQGSKGYPIDIEKGKVVSYSLVSQSAGPQKMTIKRGNTVVVETSVKSTNLSNTSTGSFTSQGGTYNVYFSAHDIRVDEAVINAGDFVVTKTYLFAGEDSTDRDYQDTFATISWFRSAG